MRAGAGRAGTTHEKVPTRTAHKTSPRTRKIRVRESLDTSRLVSPKTMYQLILRAPASVQYSRIVFKLEHSRESTRPFRGAAGFARKARGHRGRCANRGGVHEGPQIRRFLNIHSALYGQSAFASSSRRFSNACTRKAQCFVHSMLSPGERRVCLLPPSLALRGPANCAVPSLKMQICTIVEN